MIAFIFLTLSFQKNKSEIGKESLEVTNLLNSILQYTTDCAIYVPQYESVRDLIKSCYNAEICSDGISTCNKLKDILGKLFDASLPTTDIGRSGILGYEFNASYTAKHTGFVLRPNVADIVYISNGKCDEKSRSVSAYESIPLDNGDIKIVLKICFVM